MDKIAKDLMADGILTGASKEKWHTSTINKILRNEKYMDDALLQKTYTTDFLTKKCIKSNSTVPQYYVEGNHEAIIPKDLFIQVHSSYQQKRETTLPYTPAPVSTASPRLFSAENVASFTGAFTGTTTAASLSSGAVSVA